jgi:hypothetical protein
MVQNTNAINKIIIILWHADQLLCKHCEVSNYITAVTRQRSINANRGTVLSVWSVPGCYKQGQLAVASELVGQPPGFSCELLVSEAGK